MFDKRWQIEVPGRPGISILTIGECVWEAEWSALHRAAASGWCETGKLWDDLRGLFEVAGKVVANDN